MRISQEYVFFRHFCAYYEKYQDLDYLDASIKPCIENADKLQNWFQGVYSAFKVNDSGAFEHDNHLVDVKDVGDLRETLWFMGGLRGRDGGTVFPTMPNIFHRTGRGYKALSPLNYDMALWAAAVLEISPSFLVARNTLRLPAFPERSWFYADNIQDAFFDLSFYPDHPIFTQRFFCGRMWIPKLNDHVGVCILRLDDFIQLSVTSDVSMPGPIWRWDHLLFGLADQLSISGPGVFSMAVPYLSTSRTRIFRLTWPRNIAPRTRYYLYSRVFSPRTEEVTLYIDSTCVSERTIKSPLRKKTEVSRAIGNAIWKPFLQEKHARLAVQQTSAGLFKS